MHDREFVTAISSRNRNLEGMRAPRPLRFQSLFRYLWWCKCVHAILFAHACIILIRCRCGRDYCTADELKSVADAMASNGMREAGYEYINLDGESIG